MKKERHSIILRYREKPCLVSFNRLQEKTLSLHQTEGNNTGNRYYLYMTSSLVFTPLWRMNSKAIFVRVCALVHKM
jgi:hypothetical protein